MGGDDDREAKRDMPTKVVAVARDKEQVWWRHRLKAGGVSSGEKMGHVWLEVQAAIDRIGVGL